MLHKLQASFIIIEPDLPIRIGLTPGLHHWPHTVWDLARFVCLVNDLWNKLWVMISLTCWVFV